MLVSFEQMFVMASAVVAVLVWIESSWTLKNAGKLPEVSAFAIISLISSAWFAASGLALFFLELDNLQMSVAAVYGLHCVAGWFYSAKLISATDIDDPRDLVIPEKYLNFSRSFALVFLALCIFVLLVPKLPIATAFGYK
ncbi:MULTISPECIES: hypothetical protein [unclassified Moraxella]|uniref:hypothetical protein n=1 Tax=unclassified Moraxella TaxID=2685852 RepID=UPI00359D47AD